MRVPHPILASTQDTSDTFRTRGGISFLLLSGHAGGTWKLQVEDPDGVWVDVTGDQGVQFNDDGYQVFYADSELTFRLTGGTVGAKAWLTTGVYVPGRL